MTLIHTPAHSISIPDRIEDDVTGTGFDVWNDTDADDPRTRIPDEHAALYVYNGPRGNKDSEVPENVVAQAFARFNETLPSDAHAFAATVRWLNVFHPDLKVDAEMRTIRGYSQGDWADVFAVVAEGYGTAESHIDEYRMWCFGDVWVVDPDDDDSLSGIYADSAEDAVKFYLENHAPQATTTEEAETAPTPIAAPGDLLPSATWAEVTRWTVDDGTVVADTGDRKPGVHFYPRREDDRLLADPVGLAKVLQAAAEHLAAHTPAEDSPTDRKDPS